MRIPVATTRGCVLADKVPAVVGGDGRVRTVDVGAALELSAHVLVGALGRQRHSLYSACAWQDRKRRRRLPAMDDNTGHRNRRQGK